jgi:uncharacterized protein YkwD
MWQSGPKYRRWFVSLLLVAFGLPAWQTVVLALAPQSATSPRASSAGFDAMSEAALLDLINQARADHGLQPLAVDDRLTQAARKHSELMVEHSALSHQFEGEPPVQIRFSDESFPSDREGENVDLDQTVNSAHQALMHSPAHRANILDPNYNAVGIGIVRSRGNIYVTEDFARRLPEYSEPEADAALQHAIEHYERSRGLTAPVRKPQSSLRHMACEMALNDALDDQGPAALPGVHESFAWTAGDPAKLPSGVMKVLSQGLPSGYSLGACFAPSVSHPGGIYWVVMVSY